MKNGEKEGKELSVGVTVLYTKFDTYVVGRRRRSEVRSRWNGWWEHRGTRRCSPGREICFYFVKMGWTACLFYAKAVPEKIGDHEKTDGCCGYKLVLLVASNGHASHRVLLRNAGFLL